MADSSSYNRGNEEEEEEEEIDETVSYGISKMLNMLLTHTA